MKTSQQGLDLIKSHEGLRLTAYLCPAGVWTIGYGHTLSAKPGMIISHEQAENLLRADLNHAEKVVTGTGLGLNQNQFDALVSFVFNIGSGNFIRSTLLKLAKKDVNDPLIRHQFMRWDKGGGRVLPGLVKRRKDEADLYFTKVKLTDMDPKTEHRV